MMKLAPYVNKQKATWANIKSPNRNSEISDTQ